MWKFPITVSIQSVCNLLDPSVCQNTNIGTKKMTLSIFYCASLLMDVVILVFLFTNQYNMTFNQQLVNLFLNEIYSRLIHSLIKRYQKSYPIIKSNIFLWSMSLIASLTWCYCQRKFVFVFRWLLAIFHNSTACPKMLGAKQLVHLCHT